jgi:hypothetical protein
MGAPLVKIRSGANLRMLVRRLSTKKLLARANVLTVSIFEAVAALLSHLTSSWTVFGAVL